jgi:hypothetical protein
MNKSTNNSISCSHSNGEDRAKTVRRLESNYQGEYGEYKYYAGQTFVFKDGGIANKTLLISEEAPNHEERPYLKFRARPVYVGDTQEDLKGVIKDWEEEDAWYFSEFGDITGLKMPEEKYSICDDPLGSSNKTILISTKWIENIQGDIFRIDANKLHSYILEHPKFRKTLVGLIKKFVSLSEEDIYPDYLGVDNVAIYLESGKPRIALIDRHIVWRGKYCNEKVKARLDRANIRFKEFLKNPLKLENVKMLTGKIKS